MSLADDVGCDHVLPRFNQAQVAAGSAPGAPGPTSGAGPRSQKLRSSSPVAGLTTALVVLSAHSAAHASRGAMMAAAATGPGSCSWGPPQDARANSTPPITECIGWPLSSHQAQQQEQPSGPQEAAAAAVGSWMDLPPWPLPALMPKPGASRMSQQSAAAAASAEDAGTAAAGALGRGDLEDLSPLSSTSACPLGFRPTPPPSSEVCSANSQLLALRSGRSISSSSSSSSGGVYVRPAVVGCKRSWSAAGLETQSSGVYTSHLQHLQHGQLYAAASLEPPLSLPPLCKVARSCTGTGHAAAAAAAAGSVAFYSRQLHSSNNNYYCQQQQQQQQHASLLSSRAPVHEASPASGTEVAVLCTNHQQQQQLHLQQQQRQYLRAARRASVAPEHRYSSSASTSDCAGGWAMTTCQQQQQLQQQDSEHMCAQAGSRQQVLFTSLHNRAQLYAASASHPLVPVCDTNSCTSSSGALLAAYYRGTASAVGADVSSLSSGGGGMCSLSAGRAHYQAPHFHHLQQQQQQQQQQRVVLLKAPSAAHEQMLLWAGRLLTVNCPGPFELTRSMWRRVEGRLDDVLLLSLGVTGSRTQAVLTVLLWLASKLEGRRRAVANASQLAQPLKLLPWAVNGLELHLLQLLEWSPYSGSSCSMVVT